MCVKERQYERGRKREGECIVDNSIFFFFPSLTEVSYYLLPALTALRFKNKTTREEEVMDEKVGE